VVHQLVLGRLNHLLPDSQRVQQRKISSNTGGYARACERTGVQVVEKIADQLLADVSKRIETEPEQQLRWRLLDGSSLRLEHVPELLEDFPPGRNQHGEGHWGVVKWVGLHDIGTGLPLRPAWGPMYGAEAVSEQQLAEELLQRVEASVIVGDGNFGVFFFAYAAVRHQHQILFRLSKPRALALGAGKLLPTGERRMVWRPRDYERKKHPELPAEAEIAGRLVVVTQKGFREPLYLFTTLPDSWEKIVAGYGQRWNMELDLRTLKRTLRLHHLRGKSTEAVEKELLIAVVAYGLVRAFMALAARRAGLSPRRLSFTRCYSLLNGMIGCLCVGTAPERQQAHDRLLDYMSRSKLPKRTKPRKYLRAIWGQGKSYPKRGSLSVQEEKSK
jgi:hypothetical protein